ncbi:hypothetical protein ACMX2M_07845 [Paenibacillus polymyxa]
MDNGRLMIWVYVQGRGTHEDIAKEIHVARDIDYRGIERGKDCVFSNTRTGLEELLQWMKEFQQEHAKSDVLFGTRACRMRVVT